MRFLLYNIRYGTGTGAHFHMPLPFSGYLRRTHRNFAKIIAFIKRMRPDIVGLVEVDSGSFRFGFRNQAEVIAGALGHCHVYESKYCYTSFLQHVPLVRKQGNAIITSQGIVAQRFHYFKKGVKRLVIELDLDNVSIFLVHLSLVYRHRQEQLAGLHNLFKQIDKPIIVAGDFNALWGDQELHLFQAATGLHNANVPGLPSYPARSPRRQLDFILHSSSISIEHFEMPRVYYSDHLPLICDFKIK